jgi:hypothetical protein
MKAVEMAYPADLAERTAKVGRGNMLAGLVVMAVAWLFAGIQNGRVGLAVGAVPVVLLSAFAASTGHKEMRIGREHVGHRFLLSVDRLDWLASDGSLIGFIDPNRPFHRRFVGGLPVIELSQDYQRIEILSQWLPDLARPVDGLLLSEALRLMSWPVSWEDVEHVAVDVLPDPGLAARLEASGRRHLAAPVEIRRPPGHG